MTGLKSTRVVMDVEKERWPKMENEKLLPCPFCGGEAGYYVPGMKGHVYCKGCGAMSDGSYTNRDPDWAQEEARLWNTRVYPKGVQEAIEKQNPKKPKKDIVHYRCPNCDAMLNTYDTCECCNHCGQKLDWSE